VSINNILEAVKLRVGKFKGISIFQC